ncbi:MAG: hypothetical protein RH949_32295 [Coleofasciculus sp. A1-SPW-01]|uniref:hypothetical protein n=1 Tax=Coleofasciculus sp. A1-SPW-01 TaxID=3070819 RepID=UPI0032F58D5D
MRATSASAWSVISMQPQLELLHNCLSQQEGISVKTQIVTAILYPLSPSPPPQFGDFQVGAIVQRDRYYGIVAKIETNSYRPITIVWDSTPDEKSDCFAYTTDEIRVLHIKPLPKFIPHQTFICLPPKTVIQLEDGEILMFSQPSYFGVEAVEKDSDRITISNRCERLIVPLSSFPGFAIACTVQLPDKAKLEAASRSLSPSDLRIRCKLWLSLSAAINLLEIVYINPDYQDELKLRLIDKLNQSEWGKEYTICDLNAAWGQAWQQHLDQLMNSQGLYGLKPGDLVIKEGWKSPGTVVSVNFNFSKSFTIQCHDTTKSYNRGELSKVETVSLSANVVYQLAEDKGYFQVGIGFRTKALAKAWLKPIKRLVGRLSNLQRIDCPDYGLTGKKWEYSVERPRHKTLSKRLEYLNKVADLNLEELPR